MEKLTLLGKELGTFSSWDQVDENSIYFYGVTFNDTGKLFLRDYSPNNEVTTDFSISFETGEVLLFEMSEYDENTLEYLEVIEITINPNWAIFNK